MITKTPLHADVSLVNSSDELDVEAFKKQPINQDYKKAIFLLKDGKIHVVEK